ncbi:hypothetical protein ACJJTC_018667 [Scirpophaga incertulas]
MASGSRQMDVDESKKTDERDKEIDKIFKILGIIVDQLGQENQASLEEDLSNNIVDVDLSDELAGILMTVFTCLRKEEHDSAVERVKADKIELDFLIATAIVELMTLFKSFFDEVRTGVTRFKVRASVAKRAVKRDASGGGVSRLDPKELSQSISQYGLVNHHIPLLQGITLAPERRTGVVRSLGPLTQAILLVMEDKYHNKLVGALANSIQMLPMAQEITYCLMEARSPGAVAGILKESGDILLLPTATSTQKNYFPLLFIKVLWEGKGPEFNWSFSGSPMLKLYNSAIDSGFTFKVKTGADVLRTAEVVFHAMFGTYLEDLAILSQITTQAKWHLLKELNSVFFKRGSQKAKVFSPIKFRYISKMAQSLMTKSLGNVDPVATSRPSFSGFRKRTLSQEFLNYQMTGKASHSFSYDPMQLQFALKMTKDALMEEKDSERILTAGTKAWEEETAGVWKDSEFVPVEGNIKFFGTNN